MASATSTLMKSGCVTTPGRQFLDQVQFRIDFPAWLKTLTGRERRMIRVMMRNERTKDVSKQFEISPGRVSQLRQEFKQGWERYCGDIEENVAAVA